MSLSNFFLKISINFSGDNFNRESLRRWWELIIFDEWFYNGVFILCVFGCICFLRCYCLVIFFVYINNKYLKYIV